MAITWRNVDAPNVGDPSRTLAGAASTFSNAFSGLQDFTKQAADIDKTNWDQGKVNNYNKLQAMMAGAQNLEQAEALQPQLAEFLQSAGNQIDPRAFQDVQGFTDVMRQREVGRMQFDQTKQGHLDFKEDLGQRDVVTGLQRALLQAENPDEAARVKQAIGIYEASGMLNGRGSADLIGKAVDRERGLVTQGRDDLQWDHKKGMMPLELQQAEANLQNTRANTQKLRAAASGAGGSGAMKASELGPLLNAFKVMTENDNAGPQAVVANSVFSGPLANDAKGRAGIESLLNTTGVSAWNLLTNKTNFVDKVIRQASSGKDAVLTPDGKNLLFKDKEGNAVEVPFSQALLESAIRQDNGSVTDPAVGDVVSNLRALAKRPDVREAGVAYLSAKERVSNNQQGMAQVTEGLLQQVLGGKAEKKSR